LLRTPKTWPVTLAPASPLSATTNGRSFRDQLLQSLHPLLLLRRLRRIESTIRVQANGATALERTLKPLHVERDRFRQGHDPELGSGVIGLPDIADQPRGGRHMDIGARRLFLEERGRRPADVEGALQVNGDHRVEVVRAHLVEVHVAQVAGVVHHRVEPAEAVDRRLDHGACPRPVGDAVMVGDRASARRHDLGRDVLGRRGIGWSAIERHA
jgi:hypothetical protein